MHPEDSALTAQVASFNSLLIFHDRDLVGRDVDAGFSGYSDEDPWPSLLDEFVTWSKAQPKWLPPMVPEYRDEAPETAPLATTRQQVRAAAARDAAFSS